MTFSHPCGTSYVEFAVQHQVVPSGYVRTVFIKRFVH